MPTAASPTPGTPAGQLADLRAIAARATARPFLLSDCEGVLKVWAESALKNVTRDADGAITGWSEPGSYTSCDLVAEIELDMGTWDPGEDMDDDQRRTDLSDLVNARAALPELFADGQRIRAERNCLAAAVVFATQWTPDAPMGLREGIEEILTTMPAKVAEPSAPGDLAGPFERVTVLLTPASSAALASAAELLGDSKTDTINRALQSYALLASEVNDGSRVLIQSTENGATTA